MTTGLLIDYGSGDYTVGNTIPVSITLSGEPSAGVTLECRLTAKGSLIDPYLDFDNFTFNGIGLETEPPPPECEYEITGSGGITSTATISTSLLTNGSFESGFASWSMIGDHWLAGPLDGVSAYDGNWTAYRSALDTDGGALCQTFTYTDTVSSLRADVWVKGVGRDVDLTLDGVVLTEGETSGEWTNFTGTAVAGDGVSTVCLYSGSGLYGDDYFDAFSVVPLDGSGGVMCLPPEDRQPPDEEPPPTPEYVPEMCEYDNGEGTGTIERSIIYNGSFEEGWFGWGVIDSHSLSGPLDGASAHSGQWSVHRGTLDTQPGFVCQTFTYSPDVSSLSVGGYVRGTGGRSVSISLDGEVFANQTVTDEWLTLLGTQPANASGSSIICFRTNGDAFPGDVYADDFYVYPLDSDGEPICVSPDWRRDIDPEPFPTPDPGEDNYPFPDDNLVCVQCARPADWYAIGQWIRWLLCGLNNLFKCYLYIWLMSLANFLRGLWEWVKAGITWITQSTQTIITWAASTISYLFNYGWNAFKTQITLYFYNLVQGILESAFVQLLWSAFSLASTLWQMMLALVDNLFALMRGLVDAVITFVEMVFDILRAVAAAFGVDAYTTQEFYDDNDLGSGTFATAGPSVAKVLWMMMSSMAVVDQLLNNAAMLTLMYVVIGLMALGVTAWTFKQFQDLVTT